MGRGKGRSKGVDVTKHFLQLSDMSDGITVQVKPLRFIQVKEEDVIPTQGTEAAFAAKREAKAGPQMALCTNWMEGACHSHAACSNAHVIAYFNTPAMPTLANGVFTAQTETLQSREETDWEQRAIPFQHQQQHFRSYTQQQQQERIHHTELTNVSVELKATETSTIISPSSNRVQHGSLIPAPRSQQFRQTACGIDGLAALPNSASSNTNNSTNSMSWSRKSMGSVTPSPHVNHSVSSNAKPLSGRAAIGHAPFGHARQPRAGDAGDAGRRPSPAQVSRLRRGPFAERPSSPARSSEPGETWANPLPAPGAAGIWGDAGAPLWDAAPSQADDSARDSAARRGKLWEPLGSASAATPPEALKQRLLRDLVGTGADGGAPPTPLKSEGRNSPQQAQRSGDVSELMSLLGGHAKGHSEAVSDAVAAQPKSVNTVKHLIELLTTE